MTNSTSTINHLPTTGNLSGCHGHDGQLTSNAIILTYETSPKPRTWDLGNLQKPCKFFNPAAAKVRPVEAWKVDIRRHYLGVVAATHLKKGKWNRKCSQKMGSINKKLANQHLVAILFKSCVARLVLLLWRHFLLRGYQHLDTKEHCQSTWEAHIGHSLKKSSFDLIHHQSARQNVFVCLCVKLGGCFWSVFAGVI